MARGNHFNRKNADFVLARLKPAPGDQRLVKTGDLCLLRGQPQHTQRVMRPIPVLDFDMGLGLVAVPTARCHRDIVVVEIAASIFEYRILHRIPGLTADQQSFVESFIVAANLIKTHVGANRSEGKHRKSQQ